MWRTDRVVVIAIAVAAVLTGCAGGNPPAPAATGAPAAGDTASFEDLLARLDVLIADAEGNPSIPPAVLAEARALRIEAIAALATGDDALARDFVQAAIALFGEGRG